MDVGTEPGELYAIQLPMIWDTLGLAYSNDYGYSFITSFIDTSLIANLGGYQIFRGTEPGEFYLIRCDMDYRYYIFHTFDYGQTLELKHITQAYNHSVCWEVMQTFTGGRTPGTFYYAYCTIDSGAFLNPHTKIWLYFSRDYGATYTTYFHDLDSTYTAISWKVPTQERFRIYPNPVTDKFAIELPLNHASVEIKLYDLTGRLQSTIFIATARKKAEIDVSRIKPGIYVLKVLEGEKVVGVEKVVVQ
ncbi:MAG: T9SS type A sorting domain-containing protein [Bacteroidota bacterium]